MIKKLSDFIVNKRGVILAFMLAAAAVSIVCSQFVEINEDMTKYLPDDSNMKAGMDIMAEEFPEIETSNSIRIMFDDLTDPQKETVLEDLSAISYVDSVDFEAGSSDYNKDNHTLYVLNISCDYGSAEEKAIEASLESQFADYTMVWKNDDSGFPPIPMAFLVTALAILLAILFVMCGSWIEPLLFLVVIGVAVVINGGTNLILGSVASITNSISAILQLVLSMDYSIILMNRYRQEKDLEPDSIQAMKNALTSAFSSVSSSSFTTVMGLIMLVFMSFRIGADLGIVLAKGVFISMICVLTMLPGIILACDKVIQKTAKKSLHIPTNWAAKFSYKLRYVIVCVFAVLFVGAFLLQQQTDIAYTLADEDEIADVFPTNNTVVMVYENQDEAQMGNLTAHLEEDDNVKSVMGYHTILGRPYTSDELAETLGDMSADISLNSGMIDLLYYDYYNNGKTGNMTADEFLSFISDTVRNDQTFSGYMNDDMKAKVELLDKFTDAGALTSPMTPDELAGFFGIDPNMVNLLFLYHTARSAENGSSQTLSVKEFIDFLLDDVMSNSAFADRIDADTSDMLSSARVLVNAVISGKAWSASEMGELLGGLTENMDSSMIELMYLYAESSKNSDPEWTMTLETLLDYLVEDVLNDPRFTSVIDDDMRQKLLETLDSLDEGKKQLVTDNYSRLIITTAYPDEGAETTAFFADLEQFGNDNLDGSYYLIGNSAMNYEMQKTFDHELLFITLLTALAIFLIVALTFRSLSIPLILVLLVQCGVYITVTITGILNGSIYYLALLIVECILMGATIDYGILLTNYYCEARRTADVKDALKMAYAGSIHTIMTSGLILILVTAAVGGMFENPTITAIVKTISMGALCATILILFVLPGVLAACDKIVTKKRNASEKR